MVYTKTFTDYTSGSRKQPEFPVLNSTFTDNGLYYGKLFINTRLKIAGDMNQPGETAAWITLKPISR